MLLGAERLGDRPPQIHRERNLRRGGAEFRTYTAFHTLAKFFEVLERGMRMCLMPLYIGDALSLKPILMEF